MNHESDLTPSARTAGAWGLVLTGFGMVGVISVEGVPTIFVLFLFFLSLFCAILGGVEVRGGGGGLRALKVGATLSMPS